MGLIYCLKNIINKKRYIGKTKNIIRRYKEHININNGYAIDNAINKYGKENFKVIILEENIKEENLSERNILDRLF